MRSASHAMVILVSSVLASCGTVSDSTPDANNDPCLTNTCECDEDDDCGEFEVCDTTSTPGRICACVPAYEDDGSGCAFAGAPADPGFQADDAWVATDATRSAIDAADPGDVDPGVGVIGLEGVCELDSFTQVFTMPPRDRSEVFAVDFSFVHGIEGGGFGDFPGAAVSINNGWHRFRTSFSFEAATFCLGEGGYGGDVEFRVTPEVRGFACTDDNTELTATLRVDQLEVRHALADECPEAVGEAINPDFEGTGGWAFAVTGDGTAVFADNVGVGNSRGVQLTTTTRCSSGAATGKISLPLDSTTPNSAIEFFSAGTSLVDIKLDGRVVSRVEGGGVRRVCVPDWAKGTVQDLSFELRQIQFFSDCSGPSARSASIDTVSVVSDSACTANSNDYDNAAETFFGSPGTGPGWLPVDGATNAIISPATILNNAGSANAGSGSLLLSLRNRCTRVSAFRDIVVPEPSAAGGPALKAFANLPNSPIGSGGLGYVNGTALAVEAAGYQLTTLCIDPRYGGRPITVSAFADGGGGGCVQAIPSENVFFDDFSVTNDPSCPAEPAE